jgi:DNA-directed RNA polymerase subunit RPC12/RpoP
MKIAVTCVRCGKRYEVDGAYAGKKGKCAACGERMMIPAMEPAGYPAAPEPDAYQLDEAHSTDQSTSFTPAQGSENVEEPRPRRRSKKRSPGSSDRKRAEQTDARQAISGRTTLIGLAVVLSVAVLIAVFVPGARMNIGRGVALVGLILFLYGYGSGAYIAFTEDALYGWLYLMLPPYAAYYFVSRWDDMSSRMVMLIVGLVLLTGGGRLLEAVRPGDAADKEAIAAPP